MSCWCLQVKTRTTEANKQVAEKDDVVAEVSQVDCIEFHTLSPTR